MDPIAWITSSIVVLAAVALVLAVAVLRRYSARHQACYLYWGSGLVLVFATLLAEAFFYIGFQSVWMIQLYLFLVAFLVGLLALGSMQLIGSLRARKAYVAYFGGATLLLLGTLVLFPSNPSMIVDGIVQGNPPVPVIVTSSLLTVPGAAILIGLSGYAAYRTRRWQVLYIAVGTAVITIAGALYIATFPVSLYYAEFVGVFLLFLGFVRVPYLSARPAPTAIAAGQ